MTKHSLFPKQANDKTIRTHYHFRKRLKAIIQSNIHPTRRHALSAIRSSTRTHTHPPNHPPRPTHAIAIITQIDTSLHYINTPLKANQSVTPTKAFHNLSMKQTNKNKRTSRLGDLRLRGICLGAIRLGGIRLRAIRLGDICVSPICLGAIRLRVIRLGAIRLGDVCLRDCEGQNRRHSRISPRWKGIKTEGPPVLAFHLRDIRLRLPPVPLGLPSRGQPAIQHKQIHLMITHRAALTND